MLVYRREKPQREYVADQERLSYTNPPPPPQTSVSTMRLGEENAEDLSGDEDEKSFVLLRHAPGNSSQALIAAARTDTPKATKDPVRRILQQKISNEERYPAPKTQRHGNWEPARLEDVTDSAEPIDETVEIIDAIIENAKVENPLKLDAVKPKGDKKSKVFQHLRDSIEPGEIAQRIFSGQVALSIGEVVELSPDLQKLFTQAIASDKVVRFSVNPLELDTPATDSSPPELEDWYSMGYPRTLVSMDGGTKLSALLDCGAEVNVMTRKVMTAAGLAMRKGPRLELVTHTGHHRPFVGVCENVAINVGGLIIRTLVFIVETADHPLVLGQPFLYKGKFSQQYLPDGVYGHLTDSTETHTVVFPTLGPNHRANRSLEGRMT